MGNAKNFKGHDLDKYFNEYFKKNNLKYKIQDDMYIFTYITPPTT